MKEKIELLRDNNPELTQAMAADALGVSRQRVSQVCKRYGIALVCGKTDPRSSRTISQRHWAGDGWHDLNPTTKGAVAELIVASDLMVRGFFVYRCVSQTGPCDLIAYGKSGLLRIEVRCGSIDNEGVVSCSPPQGGRYDILAIISPDKSLHYRPPLPRT